jgi:hypothetical protein
VSEILRHALYYADTNSWHIFPAPPGTKKSHKKAEYSDGRPWGATRDLDEIRRDFERWPDANVGIVCGEISGIFVVEADTLVGHDISPHVLAGAVFGSINPIGSLSTEHDSKAEQQYSGHQRYTGFDLLENGCCCGIAEQRKE